MATREINIDNLVNGDFLVYDDETSQTPDGDGEFVRTPPAAFVAIPAAIAGGESPTEAEHNALRAALLGVRDALVASKFMLPA